MQLGLRTKLTLVMTGLVFLVVVVLSAIFVARLTSQVIHDTNTRANELAQKMFGTTAQTRPPFAQIDRSNFIRQMKLLYGPQRVFDTSYAFTMAGAPFGEVRIGISIPLLRDANSSSLRTSGAIALVALLVSTGLAMVVSGATLAPLRDISAQLDRISAGQYDTPPAETKSFAVFSGFGSFGSGADELGLVSRKISQVGH